MFRIISFLVLVAILPVGITSINAQEQSNIDDLMSAHEKVAQHMQSKNTPVQHAAEESAPLQRSPTTDELPIFLTFVNRTSGELVVGLDQNATGTADQYAAQIRQVVNSTVPVRLVSGYFVPQSCSAVDDRCDPLVGGIEIGTSGLVGTLTLPAVSNDNELGFVMSGHVADSDNVYQPARSNPAYDDVGRVIANPPGPRSSDSAFVDTLNHVTLEQKIFNPNDPANPHNVIGAKTSAQTAVYDVVHMAGIINKTVGNQNHTTTSGSVQFKGITINHPTYQTVHNQIAAGYSSLPGDSGSPIYSVDSGNDVFFHGIHAGMLCFADFPTEKQCHNGATGNSFAVYSPWEHVRSELNLMQVTGSLKLNAVLDEGFESGLLNWTESGDPNWNAGAPAESQVPGHAGTNKVAHAGGCAGGCVLRSNAVDISGYASPQLSFWRLVDASVDAGEYLGVEVSRDGGTGWTEVYRWTDGSGDDGAWHRETVDLDPYRSERFKVQFVAKADGGSEAVGVDDVLVSESGICTPPASGDWHIRDDCTLGPDTVIPAGITIHPPAVLTIPAGVTLDVDFAGHGLLIKSGAGMLMMSGSGME